MSDLDELAEIAAATAFGFQHLSDYGGVGRVQPKKPFLEFCARGHSLDGTNRLLRKRRGKTQSICRACRDLANIRRKNARRIRRASESES